MLAKYYALNVELLKVSVQISREINQAAGKQVPGDMDNEVTSASLYVEINQPLRHTGPKHRKLGI